MTIRQRLKDVNLSRRNIEAGLFRVFTRIVSTGKDVSRESAIQFVPSRRWDPCQV
jgi:hypothetical protein